MPRLIVRAGVLLAATATLAGWRSAQADQTSLEAVLAAARSYLAQYKTDLTFVLADEDTTQRVIRQDPAVPKSPRTRTTRSEVYFKFNESDGAWLAIRNVATVDGLAVENRPDLAAALLNQGTQQVARTFKAFNSQYNIGRVFRNFNEPTLVLGVLDSVRAASIEFNRKGVRRDKGSTTVTIGFKERRESASFIYDLLMRPAPVEGEFVVEAGSGRISKTVLKVTTGSVKSELTTLYAHDAKTNLLVPVSFREYYEDGIQLSGTARLNSGMQHEVITCDSRYSNFRRFAGTAKIK